jgi:NAD(P)-dependent dehydrogenase (short-subunit alcohol dehydrogenase family)
MGTLEGQRIVVVGASSGIGLATAKAAAARKAHVIMVSRSIEKLAAAARTVTGSVETRAVDMLDEAAITSTFASIGRVDHLVLTAASDENKRRAPIAELTTEQMERALDKLRGFFFATRAATPHLAPRGSITVTSGASALKPPRQGMSILAAVNAAVATFAHALALELAPIRVNALTPGVVDTPVWDDARRAEIKQWAESAELPAQRFGLPEDLADAILFVITNPYVTGHNLVVDGGLSAT